MKRKSKNSSNNKNVNDLISQETISKFNQLKKDMKKLHLKTYHFKG